MPLTLVILKSIPHRTCPQVIPDITQHRKCYSYHPGRSHCTYQIIQSSFCGPAYPNLSTTLTVRKLESRYICGGHYCVFTRAIGEVVNLRDWFRMRGVGKRVYFQHQNSRGYSWLDLDPGRGIVSRWQSTCPQDSCASVHSLRHKRSCEFSSEVFTNDPIVVLSYLIDNAWTLAALVT